LIGALVVDKMIAFQRLLISKKIAYVKSASQSVGDGIPFSP